ncbi:Acyltransferase calJ [Psilocybe cubensis]|uniref:Acyltransferase calJ n=2 Tax=Psilocybe cubensis TaxID=181762 RepID=A0ACB8GI32_PSICU|nr:Acyltransferase calJ [Psilocybe cubensis]KAH9474866.1 Acyltransferase calJ [Psilocybe cubensis]
MAALTQSGRKALDSLTARVVGEAKIPGFVFGATSVDEEIYFTSGGYNAVGRPESGKINEDSVFMICSQTKLLVHLAALQLVEQGKITFESPISDYIPEFSDLVILDDQMADVWTYKPTKTVMRLKHILNFTSGLFYPFKGYKPDKQPDGYAAAHDKKNPVSHFVSVLKCGLPGIPLLFEPGTSFAYGWSSDILGFVVEIVTGQSLETYLAENILKPLSISGTFYPTPDVRKKMVDLAYRRDGKLEAWANQVPLPEQDPERIALHFGGGGLYMSMKDYLILLRHLLQIKAGKAKSPIVSQESMRGIFEPALNEEGSAMVSRFMSMDTNMPKDSKIQWGTAMGLCETDWPGRRKKGTAFWWGWAHTFHFMDPATGVAAVFGTQLIPTGDHEVFKVVAEFEETFYAGLAK